MPYNKAKQHRALRALDLVTLGRCWQRYFGYPLIEVLMLRPRIQIKRTI